jgi:hypothetical protein
MLKSSGPALEIIMAAFDFAKMLVESILATGNRIIQAALSTIGQKDQLLVECQAKLAAALAAPALVGEELVKAQAEILAQKARADSLQAGLDDLVARLQDGSTHLAALETPAPAPTGTEEPVSVVVNPTVLTDALPAIAANSEAVLSEPVTALPEVPATVGTVEETSVEAVTPFIEASLVSGLEDLED